MDIKDKGFLDETQWPGLKQEAQAAAGPALAWVENLSIDAWDRQFSLAAKKAVGEEMQLVLFAKIVTTAQAAIIVLRFGMWQQAQVLVRVCWEALFTMGALKKDSTVVTKVLAAHHEEKRKAVNRLKHSGNPDLKAVYRQHQQAFDAALAENTQAADGYGGKGNAFNLSGLAGLEAEYAVLYTALSHAVHSTVTDMDSFAVPNGDGNYSLVNGPRFHKTTEVALALGQSLIVALAISQNANDGDDFASYLATARSRMHEIWVVSDNTKNTL